jgi:hypothetical protein
LQRNRHKQACGGIVAPQSPPCRPAGPWDACGRQSRVIARIGIGNHPGEAWTPCRSTACRDFAWMSPIPFRCASASALRRRFTKAVSHLRLLLPCSVCASGLNASMPLPPRGDPSGAIALIAGHGLSPPVTGAPKELRHGNRLTAALHRSSPLASFRPAFLRLRKWKTVATQRFCFRRALRVKIQNGYVVAFRAKTESASLPAPLLLPMPARHPFETGTENAREDRHPLTHTYAHACA